LGIPFPPDDPQRAWYYVELDLELWARKTYGDEFFEYLCTNYEPVDFLFRLAEKSSVVLLDGGGFGGPPWSVRLSMANLGEQQYQNIGRFMREAAEEYVAAWKEGTKLSTAAAATAP
jgi:aspartate 4-decarboxylase